jgi:hypothetical protein
MVNRVWKGLADILRKTVCVSSIAIPLFFTGCEPEIDTISPRIDISSPLGGKVYRTNMIPFEYSICEENFKEAWYSLDSAKTKLPLEKSGTKNLDLTNGNYKLNIYAEDLYKNSSKDSVSFSVDKNTWTYLVNPFLSTNENGRSYDLLKTREERDSLVQAKLNEDWVNEIILPNNPPEDFSEYSKQLIINFHGFEGLEGYAGDNPDSIFYYKGTLKDNGKYGLPLYNVVISSFVGSKEISHKMNAILTGEDALKWACWNLIESQRNSINLQPGQIYIPNNCEATINYTYVNDNHILENFPILKFKIEDRIAIETGYRNPEVKLITQKRNKN